MTRSAFCYTLAAVVPIVSLWLATPASRSAHGMAVSPFGWPSLLIAHCLTAVPLAAVVAGWVVARVKRNSLVAAGVAGLLFAAGGYFLTGALGEVLDSFPAEFAARCAVRSLFCFLLALPWAIATRIGSQPVRGSRVMLAVGLVVAVVLPGVWADKLAKENTDTAVDELAARRITRAARLVDGLCDLDPYRTERIQGPKHLVEFRGELAARQRRLTDLLATRPPEAVRPNDRLQYANDLLTLDRLSESEAVLRELVPTTPPANLPLARVLHLQGRYAESDAALRELLTAGLPVVSTKPSIRKACLDAFDLLVENATKRGSNADREAVLREGLENLPGEEAYFRFQLGRHYKLSGRPMDAVRELNAAVAADKGYGPSAEPLFRELRELTPACLIGR